MYTQSELVNKLLELSKTGVNEFTSGAHTDSLLGLSLIFDESFVSCYVGGTRKEISGENYNPENWELGCSNEDDFLNQLYEQSEDYNNDDFWHEEFQVRVYQGAISAFELLQDERIVDGVGPYLSVWVSDSSLNSEKGKSAVKRLNSSPVYLEFVDFIDAIT